MQFVLLQWTLQLRIPLLHLSFHFTLFSVSPLSASDQEGSIQKAIFITGVKTIISSFFFAIFTFCIADLYYGSFQKALLSIQVFNMSRTLLLSCQGHTYSSKCCRAQPQGRNVLTLVETMSCFLGNMVSQLEWKEKFSQSERSVCRASFFQFLQLSRRVLCAKGEIDRNRLKCKKNFGMDLILLNST